jgi:curli production assembly/transport component CsgF
MKKTLPILSSFAFFMPLTAAAGDLQFQYLSPSFNGVGYSSHVQTIENTEFTRKQAYKAQLKADAAAAAAAANNTLLSKFINNFESRIYAQLSQQLANQMFSDSGANTGSFDFQGTTISWSKDSSSVNLTVSDGTGTTTITVPIGTFKF